MLGSLIPAWVKWAALAAALLGAGTAGAYTMHRFDADAIDKLKLADQQAETDAIRTALDLQKRQDAATSATEIAAVKAQQQIQTVTQTVIQKVPVYVTPKSDADCVLPNGFIKLLDAAGLSADPDTLPGAAGEPNDSASGLRLSQAAALLAENLGNAALERQELIEWQAWARAQEAAAGEQQQ